MNQKNQLIKHSRKWDFSGVFVTALCLIHCLLLPILSAFIPALDFLDRRLWLEILLFVLAIFIGIFSLTTSFYQHRKIYPMILGFLGLIFLSIGVLQEWNTTNESVIRTYFLKDLNPTAILGGIFLISGHLWNIHSCHCFCNPKCIHKEHKAV